MQHTLLILQRIISHNQLKWPWNETKNSKNGVTHRSPGFNKIISSYSVGQEFKSVLRTSTSSVGNKLIISLWSLFFAKSTGLLPLTSVIW